MTKYFFETEKTNNEYEEQNVVRKDQQDIILEMMIHYQFPRSYEIIWKDISEDASCSETINNAYANN